MTPSILLNFILLSSLVKIKSPSSIDNKNLACATWSSSCTRIFSKISQSLWIMENLTGPYLTLNVNIPTLLENLNMKIPGLLFFKSRAASAVVSTLCWNAAWPSTLDMWSSVKLHDFSFLYSEKNEVSPVDWCRRHIWQRKWLKPTRDFFPLIYCDLKNLITIFTKNEEWISTKQSFLSKYILTLSLSSMRQSFSPPAFVQPLAWNIFSISVHDNSHVTHPQYVSECVPSHAIWSHLLWYRIPRLRCFPTGTSIEWASPPALFFVLSNYILIIFSYCYIFSMFYMISIIVTSFNLQVEKMKFMKKSSSEENTAYI